MTDVFEMIFRGNTKNETTERYHLTLSTHMSQRHPQLGLLRTDTYQRVDWPTLPADFRTDTVKDLILRSRLASLHLEWIVNLPLHIISSCRFQKLVLVRSA